MPAASRFDAASSSVPLARAQSTRIRPARDSDADGLIELIGGCFAEYPGCVLDVDGEIPELRAIATYAERRNGSFWTVERAGAIIACVGAVPSAVNGIELVKLYVRADARGRGLGRKLIGKVETFAYDRKARLVELWTDTRFATAHLAYSACGYVQLAETRILNDKSNTVEYLFRKVLTGSA